MVKMMSSLESNTPENDELKTVDEPNADEPSADRSSASTDAANVDSANADAANVDGANAGDSKKFDHATIYKFVGLIAFFILMGIVIVCAWPYIADVFQEGGVERVTTQVREAGVGGVFILLAFQFLQIVVAFVPGEVVQMAAGIIYGPWWGALIIWIGCIVSSAFVFILVHKLGAPFVQAMVPKKYMDKLRKFEASSKFNIIVFVLFLIPGMPKDIFTYITPLSHMRLGSFLALTNIARIPGIVVSTYAADGLVDGRIWESAIIFLVLAAISVLALLFYNRIIDALGKRTGKEFHSLDDLDD